jgi:hypothetical protein
MNVDIWQRQTLGTVTTRSVVAEMLTSDMGQRTNPLSREGLAAQSGNYVCRSNYLNERR